MEGDEGLQGEVDGGGRGEEREDDREVVDVGSGGEQLVAKGFEVL